MEIIRDDDGLEINTDDLIYIEEEKPKSKNTIINLLLIVIDFFLAIYLIYNIIVMFTK